MADPDWIGPPVEGAYWALDGKAIHYQLKRDGSLLRDDYTLDPATGTSRATADAELARLDAAAPVFDRERRRALFVRNGDVFLRELGTGALRQLSRSEAMESSPMFSADGRAALFLSNADWTRYDFATQVLSPAVVLKAEKEFTKR